MSRIGRAVVGTVRWVADWRTGAVACASALVLLLAYVVVDGKLARDRALDVAVATAEQAQDAREAATRRIDLLLERIDALEQQGRDNGALIGDLRTQVAALQEQVRQLGGQPVITSSPPTTSPLAGPGPGPGRPTPSPSTTTTTTTTAPPPEDDEPLLCRVPLIPCGGTR
jgi:type II secretory pathway pseudopilin PulG